MEKRQRGYSPMDSPRETSSTESPGYKDVGRRAEENGVRLAEAADIFGNVQTAEDYGYVSRGCVYPSLARLQRRGK